MKNLTLVKLVSNAVSYSIKKYVYRRISVVDFILWLGLYTWELKLSFDHCYSFSFCWKKKKKKGTVNKMFSKGSFV